MDRATIRQSSKRSDDEIVFYVTSFWTRGGSLESHSDDVVSVVREPDGWKVDRRSIGEREDNTDTRTYVQVFLPKEHASSCVDGRPQPDAFVRIDRLVPAYMVYELGEDTAIRELVTGPWPHEPAAVAPFPAPARVEDVDFIGGELRVTVRDRPRASGGCDVALESLTRTVRALGIRSKVRIVDPSDAR